MEDTIIINSINEILLPVEQELKLYDEQLIVPFTEVGIYTILDSKFHIQQQDNSNGAFNLDPPSEIIVITVPRTDIIMRLTFDYSDIDRLLNNKKALKAYINKAINKMKDKIGPASECVGTKYLTLQVPGDTPGNFVRHRDPLNYEIRLYSNVTRLNKG